MASLLIRILTFLMPVVIAFNGMSFSLPAFSKGAEIEYDFINENSGSAAGTVTVSAKLGGKYEFDNDYEDIRKLTVHLEDVTEAVIEVTLTPVK